EVRRPETDRPPGAALGRRSPPLRAEKVATALSSPRSGSLLRDSHSSSMVRSFSSDDIIPVGVRNQRGFGQLTFVELPRKYEPSLASAQSWRQGREKDCRTASYMDAAILTRSYRVVRHTIASNSGGVSFIPRAPWRTRAGPRCHR